MNPPQTHSLALGGPHHTLRNARRIGAAALGLLLLGGGLRLGFNWHDAQALQQRTSDSLARTVSVVQARPGQLKRSVELPGTLRGGSESIIYARSAGYVSAWYKTLGDRVRKGELLARIDAPEQDQELAQARAVREQVKVRLVQARQTFDRWEGLRQLDGVSLQDFEDRRSARDQAAADFAAADASVRRLEQLEGYRRIVAPFDGVITRRGIDVGHLISAGGKELFAIAQTDPLRLSLWVPQVYASDIRPGQEVSVRVNEMPDKGITARIEHIAGGLDPVNRSRQIDVVLANPDGKLLPGSYVEVGINLVSGVKALVVPANVVVIGQDGPRIVTVDSENRLAFRKVKLGRDLGREIEVLSGIAAEDSLVSSPSDFLMEGETVLPRQLVKPAAARDKAALAVADVSTKPETKPGTKP
jgi:RND family efflux transporter MFP subunit